MPADEHFIRSIDQLAEIQYLAEAEIEKHIRAIGKLVVAVAANETTYEIEAASDEAIPASLAETADAITTARHTLTETIENAVEVAKYGFHAKHQQNVLRNDLIGDFPIDPTD